MLQKLFYSLALTLVLVSGAWAQTTPLPCSDESLNARAAEVVAATEASARLALYVQVYKACGDDGIMGLMGAVNLIAEPAQAKLVLEEILSYLNGLDGTADLIRRLLETYGNLLSNVEPAAGEVVNPSVITFDANVEPNSTLENATEISGNQP